MITGESRPVAKAVGDRVVAGTVATDSAMRVRVDAVGEETALAGIQRLVAEAQRSAQPGPGPGRPLRRPALLRRRRRRRRSPSSPGRLSATLDEAVVRVVTVLVIACPHALGLAIPLVISLSVGLAARNGILVKDRLALERMRTVDAVLFDKTGTLTKGEHTVTGVAGVDGIDEDEVLRLAGGRRGRQRAPPGPGHRGRRPDRGAVPRAPDFRSHHRPGRRGRPSTAGATPSAGRRSSGSGRSTEPPSCAASGPRLAAPGAPRSSTSSTTTAVVGALALEDEVRPEAREAVAELQAMGRRVVMITGDARAGRRGGRPPTSASTRSSPRSCPRTRTPRWPSSRPGACRWPWSATA